MILGDLLDARVLGPAGEDLGFLVDVRLALDTLPTTARPRARPTPTTRTPRTAR